MVLNIFSMPSSSAVLIFSAAFGLTNARPWHGPTKTSGYKADEWSPKPTTLPVNPKELFKRSHLGVEVCGWLGGNSASPVACGSGSSCVHDTVHGYVGCCATSGPCTAGIYTSCVDESSSNWGHDSGLVNDGIFTCPSGQACYQNTYPGGYHQYNCGSSNQATTVQTSYSGQPTEVLLQIVFTGVVFSPSAALATTTSSSSTSSSSASTTASLTSQTSLSSSTTSSSSRTSSSSSITTHGTPNAAQAAAAATTTAAVHSSSSSNTKTIVGGVVGGLAFLTAILGVLLFFLQRRHAQRNKQRAGSFVSQLKNGQSPPNGPFQRVTPYSPDDFQSSMTERTRGTPSTIAAAFPHNHLTPPLPDMPAAFLSYNARDDRRTEDAPLVSSEIEDFSRSYNEATRYHQSPIREMARDPDYAFETPGFEVPIFAPQHALATGADPGPLEIPVLGGSTTSLVRGGSGGSGRDRERDRLMGEDKEDGGRPSRSFGSNVREEGWSPQQLRPSLPREIDIGSGVQRYQLVDNVPRGTVPVLHSPGQLRGSRVGRGRTSA